MKKYFLFASFLVSVLSANAQTFKIDTEKAVVKFNYYKHEAIGTVRGIVGEIYFDLNDLSKSKFEGTADVKTIDTENKKRDEHLMDSEYFDVDNYPKMKFSGSSVTQVEDGFKLSGTLTIKAIEQPVDFKFTFTGNIFEGKATIYSNDFGIATEKKREDSKISVRVYIPVL